jgi:hypothetical protein
VGRGPEARTKSLTAPRPTAPISESATALVQKPARGPRLPRDLVATALRAGAVPDGATGVMLERLPVAQPEEAGVEVSVPVADQASAGRPPDAHGMSRPEGSTGSSGTFEALTSPFPRRVVRSASSPR